MRDPRRIAAVFSLAVLVTVLPVAARNLAPADYLDWEPVADPQVSPDGTQVVYTRRWVDKLDGRVGVDALDRGRGRLPATASSSKAATRGGRRMARASPTWRRASPKGSRSSCAGWTPRAPRRR